MSTISEEPRPRVQGLSRSVREGTFLRSLALQGAWNPQRLQNLGLLVTLIPWLRQRELRLPERRRFCRRHYEMFNTNPYLANFIIGGLLRLETESYQTGGEGSEMVRTFRDSLARTFASLGDQLFWLGMQPALLMAACLLGYWNRVWLSLGLVILFAVCQLTLRRRALQIGYRLGLDIVELLAHPGWHRVIRATKRAALFLVGSFAGCYLARSFAPPAARDWLPLLACCSLGVGLPLLIRRRLAGEGLLLAALPVAVALAYL